MTTIVTAVRARALCVGFKLAVAAWAVGANEAARQRPSSSPLFRPRAIRFSHRLRGGRQEWPSNTGILVATRAAARCLLARSLILGDDDTLSF